MFRNVKSNIVALNLDAPPRQGDARKDQAEPRDHTLII